MKPRIRLLRLEDGECLFVCQAGAVQCCHPDLKIAYRRWTWEYSWREVKDRALKAQAYNHARTTYGL